MHGIELHLCQHAGSCSVTRNSRVLLPVWICIVMGCFCAVGGVV